MNVRKTINDFVHNPLLLKPERPLPREVAMIGAGTIGPDIGYYLKRALPDIKLYLVDVIEDPLKKAEKRLSGYTSKWLERGKLNEEMANRIQKNIICTTDYNAIKNCDLVIEAATENIALKQRIFAQIEDIVGENTIITSNTSSLPADRIFNKMNRPGRATVTHFFAPAWRSLPVEIITWDRADKHVIDYLLWMFTATGKVPIVTDNVMCFMLDRVFDNWCNEAANLLSRAAAAEIDHVAEEFVAAGPFFVLNMANGNPIIVETNTLQMEEGSAYRPASILSSVREWNTKRPGTAMDVPAAKAGVIRDILLGIVFSQSFDIVDRGIGTPADLNFGCQVALGFKKGPMDFMRMLGENDVARIMKEFHAERPGFPFPKRTLAEYQNFRRYILVDDMDGVKVLTIRRPQAMNATSDDVNNEILEVLQTYENDATVKGFILTGYGTTAFSAGADIGRFPQMLGDRGASVQYAKECANVQRFMDSMSKPIVAAVNGIAFGGGLEMAIRCHSIVAMKNARFQFPEITLGISPGIGGAVVPYRKWPAGGATFHEMLCLARTVDAKEAAAIGMVSKVVDDYYDMIQEALKEVDRLQGKVTPMPDGKVNIPPIVLPDQPMSDKLPLSREAVAIVAKTIEKGAAVVTFAEALEVGYNGFGETACTDAAKEGISAFLEKRRPEYTK
jgi:enoyl-CoA hydratase/3-hydroxyacyl-CoA dehydrogenase